MAKKQKYYVVWHGHQPGVYNTWEACQAQIKGFPQALYKAFDDKKTAEEAFKGNYWSYVNSPSKTAKAATPRKNAGEIIWESISVDAACSGNPGVMEYQGVDTKTGLQIFHQKFSLGTNNIGEFLAIVHGLALLQREGKGNVPIYSDSATAIKWVKQGHAKTQLERNAKTAALYKVIERAEAWLKANTYSNPILKWETETWGEIKADFGRK